MLVNYLLNPELGVQKLPAGWVSQIKRMEDQIILLERWRNQTILAEVIERIFKLTPSGPRHFWKLDEIDILANSLGIAKSKVYRYVNHMFQTGKLPK